MLTLASLQSLLGNLNWLCLWLSISKTMLQPLFDLLRGNRVPGSKRKLMVEASEALANQALQSMALARFTPSLPVQLLIFNTTPTLMGVLYQPTGVLEWLYTPIGGAPDY